MNFISGDAQLPITSLRITSEHPYYNILIIIMQYFFRNFLENLQILRPVSIFAKKSQIWPLFYNLQQFTPKKCFGLYILQLQQNQRRFQS